MAAKVSDGDYRPARVGTAAARNMTPVRDAVPSGCAQSSRMAFGTLDRSQACACSK